MEVSALVRDGRAWVANVGDGRADRGGGGRFVQITVGHSWVEEVRAGRVRRDELLARANRHVITRVVRGDDDLGVDVFGPFTLGPGEPPLLCSDGRRGYVPDRESAAALSPSDADAAERLVQLALAHGGADNATVAVYADA